MGCGVFPGPWGSEWLKKIVEQLSTGVGWGCSAPQGMRLTSGSFTVVTGAWRSEWPPESRKWLFSITGRRAELGSA